MYVSGTCLTVAAAAKTLEEIMEQEETAASSTSVTASNTQGEDSSLNMSPDVSLHSPSPDFETQSTMSVEGSGEDQSCDLSSDGKYEKDNKLHSTPSIFSFEFVLIYIFFAGSCRAH